MFIYFTFEHMRANLDEDVVNRNGRVYSKELLEREEKAYKERIKQGLPFGEITHFYGKNTKR